MAKVVAAVEAKAAIAAKLDTHNPQNAEGK
jgi:hypothetical protein